MDFTRDPIIETIITPKDGCKLVIRSSKGAGHEEYFADAIEIVSFGHALFFRSLERPKAFLVPVSDYEVVEVREARMVLKSLTPDRSIKIAGGREGSLKAGREEKIESVTQPVEEEVAVVKGEAEAPVEAATPPSEGRPEMKVDKKRDRRRHYRKRRGGREEVKEEEAGAVSVPPLEEEKVAIPAPEESIITPAPLSSNLLSSLLQPPPTLISETIKSYRENALFKNAFFLTEEEHYTPHDKVQELLNEDEDELAPPLQEPTYAPAEEAVEGGVQEPLEEEKPAEEYLEEQSPAEQEAFLFQSEVEAEEISSPSVLEEEFPDQMSLPLYAEEGEPTTNEDIFIDKQGEEHHLHEQHKNHTNDQSEELPF